MYKINFIIDVNYRNILYLGFGSCYPRLQASTVGLGMFTPWIRVGLLFKAKARNP
jgi:hypothetical protein